MIWVGNFKSLQSVLRRPRFDCTSLKVHTWVRSDVALISPLTEWLMHLMQASHCVDGKEEFVELALREALSNAILHGNRLDARKLVHVRCCCEPTKGVVLVIRDQGHGFNPNNVPDPLAVENLGAEHGRGIHLMRLAMDEVSFERKGTEVHMRKQSGNDNEHASPTYTNRVVRRLERRFWPGVRMVDLHVEHVGHTGLRQFFHVPRIPYPTAQRNSFRDPGHVHVAFRSPARPNPQSSSYDYSDSTSPFPVAPLPWMAHKIEKRRDLRRALQSFSFFRLLSLGYQIGGGCTANFSIFIFEIMHLTQGCQYGTV